MQNSYEEEYDGYTIYVEASADQWNPGFQWSVCKNQVEFDCGISYTIEGATSDAKDSIQNLKLEEGEL